MLPLSDLLRLARVLTRGWSRPESAPDTRRLWSRLDAALAEARRTRHALDLAVRYDLPLTTAGLRGELARHLLDLARQAEELVEAARPPIPPPDRGHWIAEIHQLESEFSDVSVRWTDRGLRVVTEPITLDGIDLGPFAIEFGWEAGCSGRGARAFAVVALQPHPAGGRDEVVHPHVDGTRLCAGEAADPIREALDGGRLVDALLLVRSVLGTYNPGSAYVPLDQWHGFRCAHCGSRGRPGSASHCEACDADLCDDCSDSCSHCTDTRCPGCLESCDACGERCCSGCQRFVAGRALCSDCRTTCSVCAALVARSEREDDRCPNCVPTESSEETPCASTA
jgi:hypothetical protein